MTDIAKLKAAAEKAKDNFIPNFMVSTRDVLELIAQTDALVAAHVNLKLLADTYRQAYEEARARIAELEARERPEPVAYISKADLDAGYPHILARKEYSKACPMAVYSAPPAPVVADERAAFNAWSNEDNLPIAGVGAKNAAWLAWQARATLCGNSVLDVPVVPDCLQRLLKHAEGLTFGSDWNNGTAAKYHRDALIQAVKDCRAAMLQGAEPVSQPYKLPMDYMQGLKDGLEWAARLAEANHPSTGDWLYDDPLELAKAIRKGPDMPAEPVQGLTLREGLAAIRNSGIAIDANKIQAERDALNALDVPDGWALVPVEPTQEMIDAHVEGVQSGGMQKGYRAMLAAAPAPGKEG